VYSYGYGEYGALGHGGIVELSIPKRVIRVNGVDAIACGEYHTLALCKGDLFAWGRGFEG
jgi:alpha-tubulin suppressor-like RCC1 family protein